MKQANLLFIFSDQHRACDLACYGNEAVYSPTYTRLAQSGLVFDNCISNSPVCVPMRGTLLTGQMPWKHGALTNDLPIRADSESVAHVLRRQGYHTGYIGKWHLGGVPRDRFLPEAERLGFEEWKVANCTHQYDASYYDDEANVRHAITGHETITQTDLALDFMQRNTGDDPWALFLSWGPPHAPYQIVPEEYKQRYAGQDIPLRPNVPEDILQTLSVHYSQEEIREQIRNYYALISLLDDQLGRILNRLEALDALDNTLIVYTSDHGDMLGSHGLTKKQLPHEESIHVPLMVSWKNRVQPGHREGLLGLVDLPVTILSLLGASFSGPTDGHDLSAMMTEPAAGRESCLICNLVPCHQATDRGHDKAWVGLRTATHTYARWDDGSPFVCFHNPDDPFQDRNLCDDPAQAETVAQLDHLTDDVLQEHGYQFRPWQQMIRDDGYLEAWNVSQRYFQREVLSPQRTVSTWT